MKSSILLNTIIHELVFDDLSFENGQEGGRLESLKGEPVQVRGFWYPLSSKEGVLASHPLLKSCCVQAPSKMDQQLLVRAEALSSLPPQRALTFEGIFDIQPAYNAKGEMVQLFVLEKAKEVPHQMFFTSWWMIGTVLFFFILIVIRWSKRG